MLHSHATNHANIKLRKDFFERSMIQSLLFCTAVDPSAVKDIVEAQTGSLARDAKAFEKAWTSHLKTKIEDKVISKTLMLNFLKIKIFANFAQSL